MIFRILSIFSEIAQHENELKFWSWKMFENVQFCSDLFNNHYNLLVSNFHLDIMYLIRNNFTVIQK